METIGTPKIWLPSLWPKNAMAEAKAPKIKVDKTIACERV